MDTDKFGGRKVLIYDRSLQGKKWQIGALLDDQDRLLEYRPLGYMAGEDMIEAEQKDSGYEVGMIVNGRVDQVRPAFGAAFISLGSLLGNSQKGFLPLPRERLEQLKVGQEMAVQIKKSADRQKGPQVSDQLEVAGQLLVLTQGRRKTGISAKITDSDRRRALAELSRSFPGLDQVSYVVRSRAVTASGRDLLDEAARLYSRYQKIRAKAVFAPVGTILDDGGGILVRYLSTISSENITQLIFTDREMFDQAGKQLAVYLPDLADKCCLYMDRSVLAQDLYRIPSQLEKAVKKQVTLREGYLFVEETETLNVIDVNTGLKLNGLDKEKSVTDFNLSVIDEIVRQIRVRNLSGVILIDFVNMSRESDRQKVLEALRKALKKDSRKSKVYGFTQLQLCEMTRERKGPSLSRLFVLS